MSGCNYKCLSKWTKILTIGISGALVALGITKFINILALASPFEYIINVYLM